MGTFSSGNPLRLSFKTNIIVFICYAVAFTFFYEDISLLINRLKGKQSTIHFSLVVWKENKLASCDVKTTALGFSGITDVHTRFQKPQQNI